MAEEKKDHVQKLKKMEAEMEQVFEMKVKEKMQKLKDSEVDVSVGCQRDMGVYTVVGGANEIMHYCGGSS